jgi:predicted hotdog family 3-hydroxylacyl-ACP dehydratase
VIEIFNFTTNAWVVLNTRSVSAMVEATNSGLVPTGAAANYVSGTTGNGDVRVRIRNTGGSTSFTASGDYLRIAFDRP